jgi:hypothetical protein
MLRWRDHKHIRDRLTQAEQFACTGDFDAAVFFGQRAIADAMGLEVPITSTTTKSDATRAFDAAIEIASRLKEIVK